MLLVEPKRRITIAEIHIYPWLLRFSPETVAPSNDKQVLQITGPQVMNHEIIFADATHLQRHALMMYANILFLAGCSRRLKEVTDVVHRPRSMQNERSDARKQIM